MNTKKFPEDFKYLPEMYEDEYFPNFLVDKIKDTIKETVKFIEEGNHTTDEIQESFDQMILKINDLQEEFDENDSEIETIARDSIGMTVDKILAYFEIDIDVEEAMRERDW